MNNQALNNSEPIDGEEIINVNNLSKSFGNKKAVNEVSLSVKRGDIFGFLGPNGSGKTTTIRMLCGLLTPDSGTGQCLGYDILKQSREIKRKVGYMTQRFSFYEELSIRENLDFVARIFGMKNRRQNVDQALERLGLTQRQHQMAGALSGGWKQRLALSACMIHQPDLLLLDEPTAGVDPQARRDFWDEIHHLAASGVTILVSTHYMDEAERCNRLAYISYGQLLEQGTPRELIENSHLSTWIVEGPKTNLIAQELKRLPTVEQVASFGTSLHVSGLDAKALHESLLTNVDTNVYQISQSQPGLEDVFIHLMQKSEDKRFA